MYNNNQININEISQIQENDDSYSQSQMSLLNEMNQGGNSMNQNQFNININKQMPMNNFQYNYNPFYFNINNNNFNNPNSNNNPIFMHNNLSQQIMMNNNNNQIFMNNNINHPMSNQIIDNQEINLFLIFSGMKLQINISPYATTKYLYDKIKEKSILKNLFF